MLGRNSVPALQVAASSPVLALLALVLALITLSDRRNGNDGRDSTAVSEAGASLEPRDQGDGRAAQKRKR